MRITSKMFAGSLLLVIQTACTAAPAWNDYVSKDFSISYPSELKQKVSGANVMFVGTGDLPDFEFITVSNGASGGGDIVECSHDVPTQMIAGVSVKPECRADAALGSEVQSVRYVVVKGGTRWEFTLATRHLISYDKSKDELIAPEKEYQRRRVAYLSLFGQMLATFK